MPKHKRRRKPKTRRYQPPTTPTIAPVVLRSRDARAFIGLGATQFSKYVRDGVLPQPITLTDDGRAVAWIKTELEAWLLARVAKRDAGKAVRP
jgi:predicted DNA-binding transcriptional regulator AlpA